MASGREDVVVALAAYRATVSAQNRSALELYVEAAERKHNSDIHDFLESLYLDSSNPPEYFQCPRDMLTYFDLIAPLYGFDGTELDPDANPEQYLRIIDDELRGQAPDGFEGELKVPDDFRTLIGLVDCIIGSGLAPHRESSQIAFIDSLAASEAEIRKRILRSSSQDKADDNLHLVGGSWEVAAGFQTGEGDGGSACVMFCRNEEKDWGWRYRVGWYQDFEIDPYDDIESFLSHYANYNKEDLDDLRWSLE